MNKQKEIDRGGLNKSSRRFDFNEPMSNKKLKATTIFRQLGRKCKWCGKGFSIYEVRVEYHKKCKLEKDRIDKRETERKRKLKILDDRQNNI